MTLIDVARWVAPTLALEPQAGCPRLDLAVGHLQFPALRFLALVLATCSGIWMFGSAFEGAWGTRRFLEFYSFGVIGAALTTIALSYSHVLGNPAIPHGGRFRRGLRNPDCLRNRLRRERNPDDSVPLLAQGQILRRDL